MEFDMAADHEITLDVPDYSKQQEAEEQAANNPDSDLQTMLPYLRRRVVKNTTVRSNKEKYFVTVCSAIVKPVRVLLHWISSYWKKIFVISCVCAVLMDPLFLYIPIINHDIKCLGMDKKLNKMAIALRSITDFSYLVDIILQVYTFGTIWRSYILIDILAILPLPQIILVFFKKARGWISLIMNSLILVQYVPRVLRIYFSCKELKESPQEEIALWVKGAFNFFLYILASHVLGAFWYYFGIQRMTTCWQYACRMENGCEPSTFDCANQFRNSILLNDSCPISPPNATIFDFGIFLQVLQHDISGSRNVPRKFSNCFWWGLRNLSSFGSNLQASINTWENLFAASISVIGLLLFLYLIGNLQTYMQLNSARREAHKHKMKIEGKAEEKGPEVESWLSVNYPFIPASSKENVKSQIMRKVKQELEGNRDFDVEDIISILPSELQRYIQRYTTLGKLRTVPKLQNMDERVLQAISKHLKPMSYAANSYIILEKEPLEMMLLILDGNVKIESSCDACASTTRETGDLCGEELVDWVSDPLFPSVLPFSTITVWAMNNVNARILTVGDLYTVVSLFREHFSTSLFAPPPDLVRFDRLGLGNLLQFRPALRIEMV